MRHALSVLLLFTVACNAGHSASGPGWLTIADTISQPSDARLGSPTGIAVGPQGELFVADAENAQVAVLDSAGSIVRYFGRRGSGPGEMVQPRSLSVSADSVWVADGGRDEVVVYTTAGEYVRSIKSLPWLAIAEVAFNEHGDGLLAQHGRDTALARRITPDGQLGSRLGRPLALPDLNFDFMKLKTALAAGDIPPSLQSHSAPAVGADRSAWVMWIVQGSVEHYSSSDSLMWTTPLPDTLLTRLRADLQARTRADTAPYGFAFPNVIVAAQPVESELWVLLQTARGVTTIGRLDANGQWLSWLHVRDTGRITAFAVTPRRDALYLLDRAEGTIVRVILPQADSRDS